VPSARRRGILHAVDRENGSFDPLAVSRTHLANERTFAAWIRTGLAVAAAGVALDQTAAPALRAGLFTVSVSASFVLLGVAMIAFGGIRYRRIASQLARLGTPPVGVARYFIYVMMAFLVILLLLVVRIVL
jgi:putative membrane protein